MMADNLLNVKLECFNVNWSLHIVHCSLEKEVPEQMILFLQRAYKYAFLHSIQITESEDSIAYIYFALLIFLSV